MAPRPRIDSVQWGVVTYSSIHHVHTAAAVRIPLHKEEDDGTVASIYNKIIMSGSRLSAMKNWMPSRKCIKMVMRLL